MGTCESEHLRASWPFTPRPCSPGCRIQPGHTTQLQTQQGWCSEQPLSNWAAEIKSSLRKLTGCNCVCVALVVHLLSCVPLFHDSMDCSPPHSSVHGILQARILEWAAIPFSRGLPNPGIEPRPPALAGRFFTTELPGKPRNKISFKCAFRI